MNKDQKQIYKSVRNLKLILYTMVAMLAIIFIVRIKDGHKKKTQTNDNSIEAEMNRQLEKLILNDYGKGISVMYTSSPEYEQLEDQDREQLRKMKNNLQLALDNDLYDEMTIMKKNREIEKAEKKLETKPNHYGYYRRVVFSLPSGEIITGIQRMEKESKESILFLRTILNNKDTTNINEIIK